VQAEVHSTPKNLLLVKTTTVTTGVPVERDKNKYKEKSHLF